MEYKEMKFTAEQIGRILDFFDHQNIALVDCDNTGDVDFPVVNRDYIRECLMEGI